MPLSLFKVERIAEWPTEKAGVTLFLIKGQTVEEPPHFLTLKTCNAWFASLCKREGEAGKYVWTGWRESRNYNEGDLITCKPDDTKFQHGEVAS